MDNGFLQDPPRLTNTFDADRVLRGRLRTLLPHDLHARLTPEWRALGEAAAGPLLALGRQAEAERPVHVPYDAWGRRIDEIRVSAAWTALHREAARWGLMAVPYEGGYGAWARVHQFALLALYGPSSAIYTCPLAMTDGAVRVLQQHDPQGLGARAVPHLTSRDPEQLWTSGQWMTERTGGSDVGGTETVARRGEDGQWRLWGTKWFTSATTSELTLLLARLEDGPPGSGGLALFYLELRRPDGTLNGIRIHRLKDKLGTKALPTAELSLEGALAIPVGDAVGGVKKITPLLNTTRLHNAINACGLMARTTQLARDYAGRRRAFGRLLAEHPLHRETLAGLQLEYAAALLLTLDGARLLGRLEANEADGVERAALRLLTPLAKLFTAKQAVAVASEGLEAFGGAGYVEDTGLPVLLRDAQVLPIWEGTTNVLSLDTLRAAVREDALAGFAELSVRRLAALGEHPSVRALSGEIAALGPAFHEMGAAGGGFTEAAARAFALRAGALVR